MKANRHKTQTQTQAGWSFTADSNHLVFLIILALTLFRTAALAISPLELGVDEAQYWLWSQTPDFGYFTKPPLIAWIIGASHSLFGHDVMAVRLPASWLQFATALVLWKTADWLYGPRAGRLAGLIWISLPAVGLGSFLISTDTPLLLSVALALLAIAGSVSGKIMPARAMVYAGIALGVGMLAKYAALYAVLGLMLIWASGRHQAKAVIKGRHLLLAILACLIAASPNLLWNATHDFSTMRHLGDNANLAKQTNDISESLIFLISQAGVAGPVVFILMLGSLWAARHERNAGWLTWMAFPVIGLMSLQAYLSEANANWAMAAYPALSVWLAGWLASGRAGDIPPSPSWRIWLGRSAIGINFAITLGLLAVSMAGTLGPLTPASDPLRRLRGWEALANDLEPLIAAHQAHRIIADRRATAALLNWHFHDRPLTIMLHDRDGVPSNHFEANHRWQRKAGSPVLVLSGTATPPDMPFIQWHGNPSLSRTIISHNHSRDIYIHKGVE